jgi:aspartyl-tRNA(Asn)/glutamyl-tRNA(Gln) amidotransferase subunit C
VATLSRSDVEHVAHLARLGLGEEELALLEGQLNHILDQYAVLSELATDDIAPTAQTIELEEHLRDDVVTSGLTGPAWRTSQNGPGPIRGPRHPGDAADRVGD